MLCSGSISLAAFQVIPEEPCTACLFLRSFLYTWNPEKNSMTRIVLLLAISVPLQGQPPGDYPFRDADASASRKMSQLRRDIESGSSSAVEDFWVEIQRNGAPLVEPIPGNKTHSYVTFVWKGSAETRNVAVINGINGAEPAKNEMLHLAGSDVWYRTYDIRNDARFTYAFSPNDSLRPLLDPARAPVAFRKDPFNPKFFPGGGIYQSWIELPEAPSEDWLVSKPSSGTPDVEQRKITSVILGGNRSLWIYKPPAFTTESEPYPLLIMFDGDAYTSLVPAPTILENLIASKRIPPLVAVFVGNTNRVTDLECSPHFSDFVATELIPWMRAEFHATNDAAATIVAGSSLGGLAASYVGFAHPDVIGNVLSLSGSYWWAPAGDPEPEWLTRQFARGPRSALRFFAAVGSMEERASQLVTNRHFRDILVAKGYPIDFREFNGVHDYLNWRDSFVQGLLALNGHSLVAPGKH
jgi:enterochelin esterase family protein